MTALMGRLAFVIAAPLLLLGCLLTPGKFASTLSINADRSFTFAYKGEVIASEASDGMKGLGDNPTTSDDDADAPGESDASFTNILFQDQAPDDAAKKAATEAKRRAIAAALSKEAGYRSVSYLGDGKFMIDYAISGVLTYNFVYPFNVDAEILLPFIAIELRGNDTVRVRAPAFANDSGSNTMPGMNEMASKLDGVFTLDTNAGIVSQNSEDGATITGARKTITWRATPLTKDAPTAVLKMAPRK